MKKFYLDSVKSHQNHWTIENKNIRKNLEKFKYIETEKKPTITKKNLLFLIKIGIEATQNHSSNRFSELILSIKKMLKI